MAAKGGCRVRGGGGGTLRHRGQIVSELRRPPLQDRPRVRSCGAALGGLSTKWHFVLVTAASGDVPRMVRKNSPEGTFNLRLGRNTLRTHIHAPSAEPQRQPGLAGRRTTMCILSAQTWERFAKTAAIAGTHPSRPSSTSWTPIPAWLACARTVSKPHMFGLSGVAVRGESSFPKLLISGTSVWSQWRV